MAVLCPSYDTTVLTLSGVMWNLLVPCCPPTPTPMGAPLRRTSPVQGLSLGLHLSPGLQWPWVCLPHEAWAEETQGMLLSVCSAGCLRGLRTHRPD